MRQLHGEVDGLQLAIVTTRKLQDAIASADQDANSDVDHKVMEFFVVFFIALRYCYFGLHGYVYMIIILWRFSCDRNGSHQ